MIIDGKAISANMLASLAQKVVSAKTRGITPCMAVILVGDDPASLAYIKQKQKAAETIGATVIFDHQPSTITKEQLGMLIAKYNYDDSIHGLIVQRPIPTSLGDVSLLLESIAPTKDIDGFLPNSSFEVPVALAVGECLKEVYRATITSQSYDDANYRLWLKEKNIVVIGRGTTAGGPIFHYFQSLDCATSQVSSQTPDPDSLTQVADIVISCVGKPHIVTSNNCKKDAILISVGIWRDEFGKLHGDYEPSEIENHVAWYTPTPGGVGPVNVACLMQNLLNTVE
ncbi:bifunctional 5,10-methylenetetrahydrofolate dehydrogenase/5,10-methenyltetrahydrofolate cyclohydrolase [Candidatus Woesebacteria bacterium]|nr:bifunctional 5,10-methylenetetrahydrofolate dehydrogenase/5,10-methenyltetrahydrofolate cyclohydrolase [Candidatus Woesebacteria bacterium]